MTRKHVKLAIKSGLDGSASLAAQAGPFIFLGSNTPVNPETGALVRTFADIPSSVCRGLVSGLLLVDIPAEKAIVQAWRVLENLKEVLAQEGSTLEELMHLRVFLRDMWDRAAVERLILEFMPEERPSTTFVGVDNLGANDGIAVHMDAIALARDSGLRRENINVSGLDELSLPFPVASRAGQFVFTTALPGVDPDTGRPVTRLAELAPEDRELAPKPLTAREEALMAQDLTIFSHVRRILGTLGASLDSVYNHANWLRFPMKEYGALTKVRSSLFSRGQLLASATSFPVSGIRWEDALFEASVRALIPSKGSDEYNKEARLKPHGLTAYNAPGLRVGPLVVTIGDVAIDTDVPRLVDSFEFLPNQARLLSYGRVHEIKPIMPQTWYIYDRLRTYIQEYGSSMADVVHQTIYMTDPADYPAVERIATLFYGAELPPTTLVPVQGVSPYSGAKIEIEVIAAAD